MLIAVAVLVAVMAVYSAIQYAFEAGKQVGRKECLCHREPTESNWV